MASTEKTNPKHHLSALGKEYPLAWRQIDDFRASRGVGLPDWPEWCFIPMAGPYAVVSGGGNNRLGIDKISDVSKLAALSAWRYRFLLSLMDGCWLVRSKNSSQVDSGIARWLLRCPGSPAGVS